MDPRFYTIDYLDKRLIGGTAHFFEGEAAAILTEFKTFPGGAKAVCGLVAAGDMQEIIEVLIPRAEAWGRANQCQFGMIESRPGWARSMKPHGYDVFQIALVKEL